MLRSFFWAKAILLSLLMLTACGGGESRPFNADAYPAATSDKHLYVVSGACYGGGVATSAGPTNTVARFNLKTGELENVVIDYNTVMPGDSPVAIADYDSDHLLVLIENATGRRCAVRARSSQSWVEFKSTKCTGFGLSS